MTGRTGTTNLGQPQKSTLLKFLRRGTRREKKKEKKGGKPAEEEIL